MRSTRSPKQRPRHSGPGWMAAEQPLHPGASLPNAARWPHGCSARPLRRSRPSPRSQADPGHKRNNCRRPARSLSRIARLSPWSLESGLFENTLQGTRRQIVAGLSMDRHAARSGWMPELAVTAPSCDQVPAVFVEQAQHGSHFHRMKVVAATLGRPPLIYDEAPVSDCSTEPNGADAFHGTSGLSSPPPAVRIQA